MLQTILVTGGSGFIGSYVVLELAKRGDKVILLDIAEPRNERKFLLREVWKDIVFEKASVGDLPSLLLIIKKHKVEKIAHLGDRVDFLYQNDHPSVSVENIIGAVNILMDEEHPTLLPDQGPSVPAYGAAKLAGEAFCHCYHKLHGISCIAIRPSSVYGFGMSAPNHIKPIVQNAVRGIPYHKSSAHEYPRGFTYGADVAHQIVLGLDVNESRLKDRIFMCAGEEFVTVGEAADIVKELIPDADIRIDSGLTEYEKMEVELRGRISCKRANKQLEWYPKYSLREGIKE
jgi:nucleoside-diphosphate-sugar epimerase